MKTIAIVVIFSIILMSGIFYHNAYAVTFTDHLGYLPSWASTMGQNQALSVCSNSVQSGTDDFKWCGEFSGYTLDHLTGKTAVTFVDHTGYIPSWASTMGQNQALSVCSNSVQYGTNDFNWCGEFSGYVLDQLNASTRVTSQQSTVPEFGPLTGMIIMISTIGVLVISRKFRN